MGLPDSDLALKVKTSGRGWTVETDGHRQQVNAVRHGAAITVFMDGRAHEFTLPDPLAVAEEDGAGGNAVLAPMTGLIKVVHAEPGAKVSTGDALVLMEAMKMEHTLTAPRDGVVADVSAKAGDQVEEGVVLIALE